MGQETGKGRYSKVTICELAHDRGIYNLQYLSPSTDFNLVL